MAGDEGFELFVDIDPLLRELGRLAFNFSAGPLTDSVVSAVQAFRGAKKRRNDLIHAVWAIPNESRDRAGIRAFRFQFRKGLQEP